MGPALSSGFSAWFGGPGTEDPQSIRWYANSADLLGLPNVSIKAGPIVTDLHTLARAGWVLRMVQRTPRHVTSTRAKITVGPNSNQDFGFRWKIRARPFYKDRREVLTDMALTNSEKFSLTHYQVKRVDVPVHDEALRKKLDEKEQEIRGLGFTRDSLIIQNQDLQAKVAVLEKELKRTGTFASRLMDENSNLWTSRRPSEALEAVLAEYKEDPFALLKEWTARKVEGMDLSNIRKRELPKEEEVDVVDNVLDLVEHLQQRASVEMSNELEERLIKALG